ncbi:MAG: S9 family peptidase [Ignavibacteria bacterium]
MKNFVLIILLFIVNLTLAQSKRTLEIDDLFKIKRISQTTLSPDNRLIAFVVTSYSMEDNKGSSDIWIYDLKTKEIKNLTNTTYSENSPVWFPDSKNLAFVSMKTGTPQIFKMNVETQSEPEQLTSLSTGATGPVISNDGKKMLFTSEVYPDCVDDECNKQKEEEKEKSKVKARIITELMYRHWDSWRDEKRSHLFLLDLETREYKDITEGSQFDVPPIALGGKLDYVFSPDGKEICYVTNTDKMLAISTNNDLWISTLDGKVKRKLTTNKGNDNQPVYSPDGKFIAYRQMIRPGFEADRQTLMLYDRDKNKIFNLTENFDRSIEEVLWLPNSKEIIFTADSQGRRVIYQIDVLTKKITTLYDKHWNTDLSISSDGSFLIFNQSSVTRPVDIFKFDLRTKEITKLTELNDSLLSQIEMMPLEEFWSKGADGVMIHSLMVKPPFFDPNKKYPMVFLVHGGPQGAWEDLWHYRWNPSLYASQGYVVIMPNPRGSTGYGQKFTDEISGDWGGKVYKDLMNAYEYAIKNFKFIDPEKTVAAGASYGGYMMNWIATQTNRFKAIVTHAGVFNTESMYGTTEELWFPEWEFKGTPWTNRKLYQKFSPHMYVDRIKTPMLITHGANDFRVPESQAFELFTSLQRLGVPSRFVYFPDETHFVAKPQNFKLWMTEIFNWFEKWLK